VDDVVGALIERLGLDAPKRLKVKRYYQRLEGGLLDPAGVSSRLQTVLSDIFGAPVDQAIQWAPPPAAPPTFLRRTEYAAAAATSPPSAAEAAEDEIDRLFTGGD
jgi:hypothetical protein